MPIEKMSEVRLSKKQKLAMGLITKQPQTEAQMARNAKSAEVLKAYQAEKKAKKQLENDAKSEEFQAAVGVKVVEKPKKWVKNPTVVPGRPPGGREFIKAGDGIIHGPGGPPPRPMQPSAALVACEDEGLSFSAYMAARDEWHAWREAKPKYTPPRTFIGESVTASYKGEPDPKVARRKIVGAAGFAPHAAGFAPHAAGFAPHAAGFAPHAAGFAPHEKKDDENDDSESIDDTRIQRKVKKVTKTVSALSKLDSKIAQLAKAPVNNPYLAMMMGR